MNQRYQYVCCLGLFCRCRSRGGNAMMSAQLCLRGILLFVCLTLLLSTAHAQYRAGIQGTILDPDGAAVGAATVTLTSKDTDISKTATSDCPPPIETGRRFREGLWVESPRPILQVSTRDSSAS